MASREREVREEATREAEQAAAATASRPLRPSTPRAEYQMGSMPYIRKVKIVWIPGDGPESALRLSPRVHITSMVT